MSDEAKLRWKGYEWARVEASTQHECCYCLDLVASDSEMYNRGSQTLQYPPWLCLDCGAAILERQRKWAAMTEAEREETLRYKESRGAKFSEQDWTGNPEVTR